MVFLAWLQFSFARAITMFRFLFVSLFIFNVNSFKEDECEAIIGKEIIKEIAGYNNTVNKILEYVLQRDFKGRTYQE